jgi:hypothetical protein
MASPSITCQKPGCRLAIEAPDKCAIDKFFNEMATSSGRINTVRLIHNNNDWIAKCTKRPDVQVTFLLAKSMHDAASAKEAKGLN